MIRLFKTGLFAASLFAMDHVIAQKGKPELSWREAGSLPMSDGLRGDLAGAVIGIHDNKLIVAGGTNFPDSMPWAGGKKKYYTTGFVLTKNAAAQFETEQQFSLPYPLGYSANCSVPGGIVVAGGENDAGISKQVFLLQWNAGERRPVITGLPDLPLPLTNAAITASRGKVYILGGETVNAVSDLMLVLDLKHTEKGWKRLPSLPYPVSHAVAVVQQNGRHECLYLVGGRKKNTGSTSKLYTSLWQFSLEKQQWHQKASLPLALAAGTGASVGKTGILLFGGDDGTTFHAVEQLIASIAAEKDPRRQQALITRKARLQSTHPGFNRQVLLYRTAADSWETAGQIPCEAPVTTTAVTWDHEIIIPGGETRAGIRTPRILAARITDPK
ncbi:hypothetical protein [Sediminibacterium soli]|uniref:hypothetical protein n=1 Tax=Sediminibacterium soli TaxID=2698829 RepID=UPI00137A6975|nr:hypothetical protein [Sediminibacterium soli]NCI45407.1 hypothetical protein [Sediminibacterium soli]